ncbi:2-C-methyl-D-erythritol 2,4-cyclodiphosphate synthase [Flammeovirga kamogawensis]|uniref:2-C-methyl-D-erythritol 2,4-cyclodiphosphate synthase n=1 Tax=Flammeovirga kamogawensis TaxID=373891 RepID=A0ABX8GWA5_9BACT|nr:2-C-methyl-D-erythritol 2,4-cyclodiphosphate synthase [Flammeovirga kamogawensis]MBB6461022.1 2-C-methyl-D-erythritol 2,4-cyclodiphosphate synthase [Flammeovirga kamogawensis]QWG07592.1 2-C-methyl-D-erythritol 2,4-cyclodiphosphate synthase [Flammeovirga kamogawensis]TRX69404.1 2-C-methyl-D-erythritol 2,4-cyclodiphosphate synthase [Flammeovirga kamogawensis]
MKIRVGQGYDVHRQGKGEELWLGGIKFDHTHGLIGHSDADVLIHAICDAILGAANMRDIGFHFADTDPQFKGIDSKILLKDVMILVRKEGWELGNIDCTIVAEKPKINPHIPAMKTCLATVMNVDEEDISLKATTSEKMGFVGREEGMAVHAVALIQKA